MDKLDLIQIISNQFQVNSLLALVYDNAQKGDLTELVNQFKDLKKIDLGNHPLYNQYTMISSLYTFIALPKEVIWYSIPPKIKINELDEKWGFKNGWELKNGGINDLELQYLIRRLRNGINHGKINCNDELIFTITDKNIKNSNDPGVNFEVEYKSLDKFIRALGFWIMTDDIKLTKL